ncbi:PfkB family carbohydrate kinase [bacterium]|nr:PfkB family carbohydrate kinase [bacterium]
MIAAIGIAVLDIIMVMDGFKNGEGSFYCDRLTSEGGGMAATALCAAAKLGSRTRLFTRIGDDMVGRYILDSVHRFGVDTTGSVTVRGRNTTCAVVFVDSVTGEKQFFSEHTKPAFTDPLPLDCSLLEGTEVLLVDGHWIDGAIEGARWARSRGIPVVADFKRMYPGLEHLMPLIDYLIIPEFFAHEITGETVPESMLKKLASIHRGIPVITGGVQGGAYLSGEEIKRFRPFLIECVDSTGAGDAFHGAFCHFLSKSLTLERCLELSSAVGALNCRALGGRNSLPSRDELKQFLIKHGVDSEFP